MTLPPEKIGDNGQRYAVHINGWPDRGWQAFGWADDLQDAVDMARSQSSRPSAEAFKVIDRHGDEPDIFETLNGDEDDA